MSLVTSRFDYSNGLLCGIPEELICKLQRVQNNAARVVMLAKKHDHITPVLKELHSGYQSSYLREMLKEYVPTRTLRSTSKNLLCELRTNMKTYCAPKLWNQLPNNIRAAGSLANLQTTTENTSVQRFIYQITMWISTSIRWACLYGKGAISNENFIIIIIFRALPEEPVQQWQGDCPVPGEVLHRTTLKHDAPVQPDDHRVPRYCTLRPLPHQGLGLCSELWLWSKDRG